MLANLLVTLALVPLPPNYTIIAEACPDGGGSCAMRDGRVYLAPGHSRFAHWHELGHVFDFEVLGEGDRRWFTARLMPGKSWNQPVGYASPAERFADAYAACAMGLTPDKETWVDSYGYLPSAARHRRICAAIRRVGARAGLPHATLPRGNECRRPGGAGTRCGGA